VIVSRIFGDVPFSAKSPVGVERSYANIGAYTAEEAISRIYAGVHFRTSNDCGTTIGEWVGSIVAQQLPKR